MKRTGNFLLNKNTLAFLFFAVLLPVLTFFFHLLNSNRYKVETQEWMSALLFLLVLQSVICLIFWIFSRKNSSYLSQLLFVFIFFYGSFRYFVEIFISFSLKHSISFVLYAALFGLIYLLTRKRKLIVERILSIVLIYNIGILLFFAIKGVGEKQEPYIEETVPVISTEIRSRPNIVYIILDEYSAPLTQKTLYNRPTDSMVHKLNQLGFQSVDSSSSIYNTTICSMGSTLNMEFLDETRLQGPNGFSVLNEYAVNNRVFRSLKKIGYTVNVYDIGFGKRFENETGYTAVRTAARNLFEFSPEIDLTNFILSKSLFIFIKPFVKIFNDNSLEMAQRSIKTTLQEIKNIKNTPGKPNFHYIHFICPHPPIIFFKDGTTNTDMNQTVTPELYFYQLDELGRLVYDAVSELVKAEPGTLVILQSDHGSKLVSYEKSNNPNIQILDAKNVFEQFTMLNTVYPGKTDFAFPVKGFHSVNTFRYVFNHFFGTKLDTLPEKHFYTSSKLPIQFIKSDSSYNHFIMPVQKGTF